MPIDTSMYQNFKGGQGLAALGQGLTQGLDIANQRKQQQAQAEQLKIQQAQAVRQQQAFESDQQDAQRKRTESHMQTLGNTAGNLLSIQDPQAAQGEWLKTREQLITSGMAKPQELPENFEAAKPMVSFYHNKHQQTQQQAALENQYKQAQIAELQARASKARHERGIGGGKQLPADKVLAVNAGNAIPKMLEDIDQTIEKNPDSFGPFVGRLGKLNPYDTKAQTIDAQVRAAAQSFGRLMEGGVLRKEDEEKYRQMFPNNTDTPAVAKNKMAVVRKQLVDKQRSDVAALKGAGYSVAGVNQDLVGAEVPEILTGFDKSSGAWKNPVSGMVPKAMANPGGAPQVKEINGALYQKVKGGWEPL